VATERRGYRAEDLHERFSDGVGEEFAARGEDELAIRLSQQAEVDEFAAFLRPGFEFLGGNSVSSSQSERDSFRSLYFGRESFRRLDG
jgi:hypothetical protein